MPYRSMIINDIVTEILFEISKFFFGTEEDKMVFLNLIQIITSIRILPEVEEIIFNQIIKKESEEKAAIQLLISYLISQLMIKSPSPFQEFNNFLDLKKEMCFYKILKSLVDDKLINDLFLSAPYLSFKERCKENNNFAEIITFRKMDAIFRLIIKNLDSFSEFSAHVSDNTKAKATKAPLDEYVILLLFISWLKTCHLFNIHISKIHIILLHQKNFLDYYSNFFKSLLFKKPKLATNFFSEAFFYDLLKPLDRRLDIKVPRIVFKHNDEMTKLKDFYDSFFKNLVGDKTPFTKREDANYLKDQLLKSELSAKSIEIINLIIYFQLQFEKITVDFDNKDKNSKDVKNLRVTKTIFYYIIKNFDNSYVFYKFKDHIVITTDSKIDILILLERYLMLLLFACWLEVKCLIGQNEVLKKETFSSQFNEFKSSYFPKSNSDILNFKDTFFYHFFENLFNWVKKSISELMKEPTQQTTAPRPNQN